MATTRQPRRAPTMQTPKPLTLNVEEWEAKAPLSDREIASVGTVRLACEQIPLPSKFDDDDATGSSSRPSTPVGSRLRPHPATPGGISRPNSPMPGYKPLQTHALHPKHAIQTAQQFYDWFALIERSVAHSQEAHFRAHVASVSEHLDTCDRLVERVDEVGLQVDDMLEGWRGVEEGGRSLKDACERLLEERDRLLSLTDEIGARLEYFQELDVATRMLNHPGESLVLQTDFLYMVERVDICIDYLKAHRHFRESEVYLLRFQQCMTRAMTLVRMYFVASLKTLSADISKRMGEKDVSHTAQTHLLYTRFRSVSTHLAPLLGDLERRAASHPAELSALLSECHSAYLSTRKSLLVGRLVQEIRGLDPGRTELVELTRAGCSYLKQLCTDEWSLYQEFFRTGEDMLYQYLETLCDYLYDDLRPRILHEPRLTALCEVCTVLQALMVLDSAGAEVDDDEEDESSEGPISRKSKPRPLHIAHLLSMVLQDAQTRLFFKAQAVIQSDIRYYVPKTDNGDLAWPEAILLDGGAAPLDQQGTWYPTVQKTVWVLEQLRDFVNPAIFEDIAQEAVTLCRQSLVLAADMIKQRPTSEKTNSHDKSTQVPPLPPVLVGTLDGDLFLVRHLLVLKEITHNLDLRLGHFDAGEQDIDRYLYGVGDTLAAILNRTSSLLPGAILASLGMPRTDEGIRDAKQGIDHDLKRVCEEIIITCAAAMCDPLRSWLEQVESHNALRASTSTSTKTTPESLAQPAAEALEQSFRKACATELSAAAMRIRLYLGGTSGGSAEVLLAHVRERAIEEYTRFREVVTGMYAGGMRGIVMERAEVRALLDKACSEGMQIKGQ